MKNSKKILDEVISLLPKKIQKVINEELNSDNLFVIPEKTSYITSLCERITKKKSDYWINGTTIEFQGSFFVYFSSTEYKRNKANGCEILAHELTHVWQSVTKNEWYTLNSSPNYDENAVEEEAKYYGRFAKHKLAKNKILKCKK